MREIRFRAWDKIDKTMCISTSHIETWFEMKNRYELMQFTGLLDKNGKEIYEGDIVLAGEEDIHAKVEWTGQNNLLGFCLVDKTSVFDIRDFAHRNLREYTTLQIIGNIYEHSHLLKN